MVLFKKVLAITVLTGAGVAGYKYLTHKSEKEKSLEKVKSIANNKYFKEKAKIKEDQVAAVQEFFKRDNNKPDSSFVNF